MERKIGLFSRRARSKASGPQAYQSTGLCACWRRYGLCSAASRFMRIPFLPQFSDGASQLLAGLCRHRADRTAADAAGEARELHRFLDHPGKSMETDSGAELGDQRLQPRRFLALACAEGGIKI